MVADIIEQCSRLKIVNEEDDITDFEDKEDEASNAKLSLHLVGKLLTTKPFNSEALKHTLQVQSLQEGVVIRYMGANLFIFQFLHWRDMEKVLNGRP